MEKEEMREQLVREAEERVKEGTRSALAAQEMMLRAEVVEAARREAELGEEKVANAQMRKRGRQRLPRNISQLLLRVHLTVSSLEGFQSVISFRFRALDDFAARNRSTAQERNSCNFITPRYVSK